MGYGHLGLLGLLDVVILEKELDKLFITFFIRKNFHSKETKEIKMTTLSSWGNLGPLGDTNPDGAFEVGSFATPKVQVLANIICLVSGWLAHRVPLSINGIPVLNINRTERPRVGSKVPHKIV